MSVQSEITLVEKMIAKILAALEQGTGGIISGVCIIDQDVSRLADERPTLLRRVEITLQPERPNIQWDI